MSSEKAKHSREDAIAQALAEVGERGQALTPFLLARISELTGAASLRANLALLENNARVGARIAVAVAELEIRDRSSISRLLFPHSSHIIRVSEDV